MKIHFLAPLLLVAFFISGCLVQAEECGQEGQVTCSFFSYEFWNNGSGLCDRGLRGDFSGKCRNLTRRRVNIDPWLSQALSYQRSLALDSPINQTQWINAHNAFNNVSDGYILAPNQSYSVSDLLLMGVRSLSLDVHWFNSALRLCHGHADGLGCGPTDRFFIDAIREINVWLRLPENQNEVIRLEIEDYLFGHDEAFFSMIKKYLGDLIYYPQLKDAARWPSARELIAQGKRVLIFASACHNTPAFCDDSLPRYGSNTQQYFSAFPNCGYVDSSSGFHSIFADKNLFHWFAENRLWTMNPFNEDVIDTQILAQLAKCNISIVGLDFIDNERLKGAVWSFEEGAFAPQNDACVAIQSNGRWKQEDCSVLLPKACQSLHNPYEWLLAAVCQPGYKFSRPINGLENSYLTQILHGQKAWLR